MASEKPRCRLCARCTRPFILRDERQRYCDISCYASAACVRRLRDYEQRKVDKRNRAQEAQEQKTRRKLAESLASLRW